MRHQTATRNTAAAASLPCRAGTGRTRARTAAPATLPLGPAPLRTEHGCNTSRAAVTCSGGDASASQTKQTNMCTHFVQVEQGHAATLDGIHRGRVELGDCRQHSTRAAARRRERSDFQPHGRRGVSGATCGRAHAGERGVSRCLLFSAVFTTFVCCCFSMKPDSSFQRPETRGAVAMSPD